MKKLMLLAAFLVACGPREEPATDTAAMAAGPAALTPADIAGTWNGVSTVEGQDSVVRWTVISTGTEGRAVFAGMPDTVTFTHTFDADSFVAVSAPYTNQMMPGKPRVTTRAVGRLVDGKIVGTGTDMLVSKPDSIVSRARFEATKAP